MAEVINLFDQTDAYVVCKECGSDTWHFLCDPNTEPPVFTQIWCATEDCDTGCEIELREITKGGNHEEPSEGS